MGILVLAVEGKLDLNDPLSKHLPEFSNYPDTVTIHQMLVHPSGITAKDTVRGRAAWLALKIIGKSKMPVNHSN